MSKRDWRLYVEDILECIELIQKYTDNMEFLDFLRDRKTLDAVVRNFEVIGEASKYVPEEAKKQHQEIDWQGIVGLRNRIAHKYFDVSPRIIWEIVKDELPPLKEQMRQMLKAQE
jgi:uncharacterized protein with HEPN domain